MTELHPSYQRISDVRDALDAVEQTKHAIAAADWALSGTTLMKVIREHPEDVEAVGAALAMVGIRAISTFDKEVLVVAQDQAMAAMERDVPADGDSSAIIVVRGDCGRETRSCLRCGEFIGHPHGELCDAHD